MQAGPAAQARRSKEGGKWLLAALQRWEQGDAWLKQQEPPWGLARAFQAAARFSKQAFYLCSCCKTIDIA